MVHPTQQDQHVGSRKPVSCVVLVRKGTMRVLKVRPWLAGAILGVSVLFVTAYVAASAYLIYRDDLLGATFARQVRMQYEYEDRIAALRAELDRATSRQAVDTQGVEEQLATLLERQAVIEGRQATLDTLVQKARDSSVEVAANAARLPRARPEAVAAAAPAAVAPPETLAYAPVDSHPADIITGSLVRTPQAADASAETSSIRPILSRMQSSLNAVQEQQTQSLHTLDKAARSETDRLSGALAPVGIALDQVQQAEPQGGPFIPAGGLRFVEQAAVLNRTLDDIAALRQRAQDLPLRAPVADLKLSSRFGYRKDPFLGRAALHSGLDFVAASGTDVRATAPGRVVSAGWTGGYGQMVEIKHANGVSTRYGHLSSVLVAKGARVASGALIGRVGSTGRSTGPHLHYETRRDGKAVDPAVYLAAGKAL